MEVITREESLSDGRVVRRLYENGQKLLSEHFLDQDRREIERKEYKDDGSILRRNIYEYEGKSVKYKRLRSFDGAGKLVLEHEDGKRPVITS